MLVEARESNPMRAADHRPLGKAPYSHEPGAKKKTNKIIKNSVIRALARAKQYLETFSNEQCGDGRGRASVLFRYYNAVITVRPASRPFPETLPDPHGQGRDNLKQLSNHYTVASPSRVPPVSTCVMRMPPHTIVLYTFKPKIV